MVERPKLQIQRKSRPKLQIQRSREDEGLFQNVDEFIIQKICTNMIQDQRYYDLHLLLRTNSVFKRACQGLMRQEYQRLKDQPPTEIDHFGTRRWRDSEGKIHRDGDFPAVIDATGPMTWFQHGQIHREGDRPARIGADGTRMWWKNGEVHRDNDRPAIMQSDGIQIWRSHGRIHRDGNRPAVMVPQLGINLWFQKGQLLQINDYVLSSDKRGRSIIKDKNGNQIPLSNYDDQNMEFSTNEDNQLIIRLFQRNIHVRRINDHVVITSNHVG